MIENVILVNELDQEVGSMEKMEAHEKGLLHRAFSVFIFNEKGEVLLQQRALGKYHSGGLWTNTCCSHPRAGESTIAAGKRRLFEEMGFTCELESLFSFVYKVQLDQGLTEHELDHVLIGNYLGTFTPNPEEVMNTAWMPLDALILDCQDRPEKYTSWLQIIINEYANHLKQAVAA
jgi:isopentenyl-diphosphate delta-isomerase